MDKTKDLSLQTNAEEIPKLQTMGRIKFALSIITINFIFFLQFNENTKFSSLWIAIMFLLIFDAKIVQRRLHDICLNNPNEGTLFISVIPNILCAAFILAIDYSHGLQLLTEILGDPKDAVFLFVIMSIFMLTRNITLSVLPSGWWKNYREKKKQKEEI